jgi:hypothetical protein
MQKIISWAVLLTILGATVLVNHHTNAKTRECGLERGTRYRVGRETFYTPPPPCPDEADPPVAAPISQKDLNVVLQDVSAATHIQPGAESVTVARVLLDASNSDKDVRTISMEFDISISSYADFGGLDNCGLYQDELFIEPASVARATVTDVGIDMTTSQDVQTYSIPSNSLVTPRQDKIYVDLKCDFPPILTEAIILTKISNNNFFAIDPNGRSVDYSINSDPGHTIEVYSGDTRPWDPIVPADGPVPGNDGEDGDDGADGVDGQPDGDEPDGDGRQTDRQDRQDKPDRRK